MRKRLWPLADPVPAINVGNIPPLELPMEAKRRLSACRSATPAHLPRIMTILRNCNYRSVIRRGSALTELAACLPLLLLLTVAAGEAAHAIQIQQSLKTVAYETARAAAVPGVSNKDVERFANGLLHERRIAAGKIEFTPEILAAVQGGDFVRVQISAPHRHNSVVIGWLFSWRNMVAHAELMKEQ